MSIKIKADHEDTIYHAQTFIQNLERVQQREFDELFEELKKDGFCDSWSSEEEANEWLFDYIFNGDQTEDFWEYLDSFGLELDD